MHYSLTKGDIIIFKAEDNWFSKAIAALTHSDVCHAAMAYTENSIVEVGANGIVISQVDIQNGDEVYVLRLKSEPDSAPLIRSAEAYLNAETRYDFPGLFLLAGILIYQYFVPEPKLLKAANHIFDAACFTLDKMIQHALKYQSRAMVCSQLIYQIFYDCGNDYRIRISEGCLWKGSAAIPPGSVRLADSMTADSSISYTPLSRPADNLTPPDTELLAKDLYLTLSEAKDSDDFHSQSSEGTADGLSCTVRKAEDFLSRLQHFLKLVNCDMPIDAMFVTPADILYHSSNLKKEGMLTLTRIHHH